MISDKLYLSHRVLLFFRFSFSSTSESIVRIPILFLFSLLTFCVMHLKAETNSKNTSIFSSETTQRKSIKKIFVSIVYLLIRFYTEREREKTRREKRMNAVFLRLYVQSFDCKHKEKNWKALLFCTFDERRELHEEVNENLKLLSPHHSLVLSLFLTSS